MKSRALCISVSRTNRKYLDMIDDYALEFDSCRAETFFRILREYNRYREEEYANR
jgi:hypothetical protein